MSGHHANIEKWRREQSIIRTARRRPDLLKKGRSHQQRMEFFAAAEKAVERGRNPKMRTSDFYYELPSGTDRSGSAGGQKFFQTYASFYGRWQY